MRTRPLGKTGLSIGAMGFGAMPLSLRDRPEEAIGLEVLRHAQQAGATWWDTADTYCLGPGELHHNERLVAQAAAESAVPIVIATKGGTHRTERGWEVDGSPDFISQSIEASYAALGGHTPITVWQLHWPDPRYPLKTTLAPVRRAVDQKLIRFVGLCNVSVEQLREASECVPVVSVQNQYNLWHREPEFDGTLEYCERHDLLFLPWRPLGGLGLSEKLPDIAPLARLARERQLSPQRLMLAWHLAKSPCVVPIPGTRSRQHADDCWQALDVRLESAEIRLLDALSERGLPRRERPAAWEAMPPLWQG